MADGAVRWPWSSVTPCAAQRSWETSSRVRPSFPKLRIDRLSFRAFSTAMPPSVRGSGSLITPDASSWEGPLFSDAAIRAISMRAKQITKVIPNLFIIPPYLDQFESRIYYKFSSEGLRINRSASLVASFAHLLHPIMGKDLRRSAFYALQYFLGNIFRGISRERGAARLLPALLCRLFYGALLEIG
ncbi:Uncharacterised protein [uncultured archaeon]|nr:Uncharacterised protein [uncultured archaeon]